MRKSVDHVNQKDVPDAARPADVLEAVHALMHQARARHHRLLREAGHELTPMEGRVLGFFARHPGASLTELAEHSGRDKGQLTRLVQGLRERGLLEATTDEADRRITRLTLSAPAQALHQAVVRQRKRLAEAAAAGLSDDERATLMTLLARISANLGG